MQRSISYKNPIVLATYFIAFVGYESLCSIYMFLPPLFTLLFVLYLDALRNKKTLNLIFILLSLMVYEASMGFSLFSSVIYFTFLYKFVVPKLESSINQVYVINIIYVLLAYLGYFLFLELSSSIFLLQSPHISYYVIYYMLIEFFIVSLV